MKIFVNNGAVKQRQMDKEIAPLSAREVLQDNILREQRTSQGLTDRGKQTLSGIRDKTQAIKEKEKWEKTFNRTAPETLSIEAKNAMWKRAKQLKDEFTVGMLSKDELHPVKFDGKKTVVDEEKMRTSNSVKRQQAWNKKMGDKVKEFKNIMRHLEPDNPGATDIERFRPLRRVR